MYRVWHWLETHSLILQLWSVIDAHYSHSAIYRYVQRRQGYVLHILAIGALWTLLICRAMSRNFERATYELLAITPNNTPLSAGLFISMGVMHRNVEVRGQLLAASVWIARGIVLIAWLRMRPPVYSEDDVLAWALPFLTVWIPAMLLVWLKFYDLVLAPILGLTFAHTYQDSNFIPFIAALGHVLLLFMPLLLLFVANSYLASLGILYFWVGMQITLIAILLLCELIVRVWWFNLRLSLNVTQEDVHLLLGAHL